jgi:alkylhydroperoxidase family enzyme
MTKPEPRIRPLPPGPIPAEVRAALEGWLRPGASAIPPPLDTFARHPKLAHGYLAFSRHLLFSSTLPARERELVILRTAVITGSAFERQQHEVMALKEGLSEDAVKRIGDGLDTGGWSLEDALLLRATDELLSRWTITQATWDQLSARFDDYQLMDLVFTVGGYALLAMAFNSFGVEPAEKPLSEGWKSDAGGGN